MADENTAQASGIPGTTVDIASVNVCVSKSEVVNRIRALANAPILRVSISGGGTSQDSHIEFREVVFVERKELELFAQMLETSPESTPTTPS